MSKKHFEAMAAYIRQLREQATDNPQDPWPDQQARACEQMCLALGIQFNERFDARRFLDACQPTQPTQPTQPRD